MADLKFSDATASAGEIAAVDAVLGDERGLVQVHERLVRGGTARRHRLRHLLLPALHALQNESGWISPGGLNYVSEALQVPPAEAYGAGRPVDMMDKAIALTTSPQAQQQQQDVIIGFLAA